MSNGRPPAEKSSIDSFQWNHKKYNKYTFLSSPIKKNEKKRSLEIQTYVHRTSGPCRAQSRVYGKSANAARNDCNNNCKKILESGQEEYIRIVGFASIDGNSRDTVDSSSATIRGFVTRVPRPSVSPSYRSVTRVPCVECFFICMWPLARTPLRIPVCSRFKFNFRVDFQLLYYIFYIYIYIYSMYIIYGKLCLDLTRYEIKVKNLSFGD